jgi:hypothetical protein
MYLVDLQNADPTYCSPVPQRLKLPRGGNYQDRGVEEIDARRASGRPRRLILKE